MPLVVSSPSSSSVQAVPFPCVVYRREGERGVYVFSHICSSWFHKAFPASLRVTDLRSHHSVNNWSTIRNTCFLILVAGDVAQGVCVSNHKDRRASFLYTGSEYAKQSVVFSSQSLLHTEFHDAFVPLHFFGTMASYDTGNHFRCAIPIESGIILFPCKIIESDINKLARWVENAIQKAMGSSVWVTECGQRYNEQTFRMVITRSK
jgi:hypothetical protein